MRVAILVTFVLFAFMVSMAEAKGSYYSTRRTGRYSYSSEDGNVYDRYGRYAVYEQQFTGDRNFIYGTYYSAAASSAPAMGLLFSSVALVCMMFLRFFDRN